MEASRTTLEIPSCDELVFIDGAEVGTGAESDLYVDDGDHPSEAGRAALGHALAARVENEFLS